MYKGYIENGRRYQTVREDKYWGPSDEQQFETFEAGHLMYQILDSQEENTLFRSPIPENAQVCATWLSVNCGYSPLTSRVAHN